MLSELFFDVLAISNKAKESFHQWHGYLCKDEWKRYFPNKEAHKMKSEDFTEEYELDNDRWKAKLILYCGYDENHKCKVFDWDLDEEEKPYWEEYQYERECYPHL